jgi:hypothetical protein
MRNRFILLLLVLAAASSVAGQANSSASGVDLRRGQTLQFASISASSSGDNTVVSADATRRIRVLSYVVVSAGTVNVAWKSGAGTSLSGAMPLVANTGVASPIGTPSGGWLLETATNQALVLNLSAAIAVTGHLSYFLE